MILAKIKNFLLRNKKLIFISLFIVLIIHFDFSFAEESWKTTTSKDWYSMLIDAINTLAKFWAVILALVTELVWWFLSPGWTTWKAIWFHYHLKELWIMVSNVVYLMFAIILIWIAFMNILWKTGDWELKQAMPKFIVWVLIVPFSWMIVSATIWISSILTASVLSIPRDSFPETYSVLDDIPFYTTYTFNIWKSQGKDDLPVEVSDETTFWEFLAWQNNLFGIMNVYTFWIMSIDNNWKLHFWDVTWGITRLVDLWTKWLFDLLFFVVYFILMIALLMALFVRWIYIWLFMILSPFFGLMYFFWDKWPTKALSEKFSFEKFIWLAMMPVYVAWALAFWLLFILVAGKWMSEDWGKCDSRDESNLKMCFTTTDKESSIEFLWIKLKFNWTFSDSWAINWMFWEFKGSFATLLLQIFGLAILRIAVMAALGSSELTKEVVQPIKQFWDSVWSLAAKAPTYMPLIPGPGWKMMSATELWQASSSFVGDINTHFTNKWSEIGHALSPFWNSITAKLDQINNSINKSNLTNADKINDVLTNKVWSELSKVSNALLDVWTREKLLEILEKIFWASAIEKAKLKWEKDPHIFAKKLKNIKLWSDAAPWAQDYVNKVLKGKTEDEIVKMLWLSGKLSSSDSWSGDTDKKETVKRDITDSIKNIIQTTKDGKENFKTSLDSNDIKKLAEIIKTQNWTKEWHFTASEFENELTNKFKNDLFKNTELAGKSVTIAKKVVEQIEKENKKFFKEKK